MTIEGGCYCGAVRYRAEGEPQMRVQCHCRECQYISAEKQDFHHVPEGAVVFDGLPG